MSDFTPDCYAIRSNGQPMPARFVSLDAGGFIEVAAPNGKTYTFPAEYVLPVEEVEAQIHANKVDYVASNYCFEELSSRHGRREVRCTNPAHPIRSCYILTITRSRSACTCPAFVKSSGAGCKHLEAFASTTTPPAPETAAPEAPPVKKYETFTAEEW
jgi:hypothetical protein